MATAKSYLTLVNDAIRESGCDLDALTAGNFASDTTNPSLAVKMKTWVNDAYREIQMERQEMEKTKVLVWKPLRPRYRVDSTASPAPTAQTDYILGQESGALARVVGTSDSVGTWTAGSFIGALELDDTPVWDPFKFGENIDRTDSAGTVATANWAVISGWGRYDLTAAYLHRNTSYSVFEPDTANVYLSSGTQDEIATSSAYYDENTLVQNRQLVFVPWDVWIMSGYEDSALRGQPVYFTETPEGQYDFYPRPDTEYRLRYYAQMTIDELSAHGDTPDNLPNDYHDMIYWRAVMYYAMYDKKMDKLQAAKVRFQFYKTRLENLLMPRITWEPSRYQR